MPRESLENIARPLTAEDNTDGDATASDGRVPAHS
jgi:hypothetical protein